MNDASKKSKRRKARPLPSHLLAECQQREKDRIKEEQRSKFRRIVFDERHLFQEPRYPDDADIESMRRIDDHKRESLQEALRWLNLEGERLGLSTAERSVAMREVLGSASCSTGFGGAE